MIPCSVYILGGPVELSCSEFDNDSVLRVILGGPVELSCSEFDNDSVLRVILRGPVELSCSEFDNDSVLRVILGGPVELSCSEFDNDSLLRPQDELKHRSQIVFSLHGLDVQPPQHGRQHNLFFHQGKLLSCERIP